MIGILLVTHTPLSAAFLAAATHVYKKAPDNVRALDVIADQDPYEVNELVAEALLELDDGDGVLILTDICGATPANCAQRMANLSSNTRLVYGLNVPMLLRALNYRHLPLAQVVEKALDGGKNGVASYADETSMSTCAP
ncbi:PTS system mannose-specific EIIAB component [Ephemeroptericola cinctiostellae]|uniref:PTS system mannose-specific EIIAB component n=1 Tax=Ephemeroptericola cinctiostellae TaxID=2268024 RepID=A0A345DEE2_9BURK|nr:PTS fructose transporter subunit IIA [Ephemeroptericola cinctiostellae]AXF86730.1 PTS system mannose-specific EIIAB component [Ephemeroptericola cinctiostellae]